MEMQHLLYALQAVLPTLLLLLLGAFLRRIHLLTERFASEGDKLCMQVLFPVLIFRNILQGQGETDVYLKSFSVDKKCNQMTIEVGVSSSAGYVRKMKQTSGSMNYYYTFYSTFGINSKLGARDTFEIQLDNNVDEIYFYTGEKGYKKVFIKKGETKTVCFEKFSKNANEVSVKTYTLL